MLASQGKGGKVKNRSLEEVIMSDDILPGETQINFDKAADFKAACEILEKLKQQGKLEYVAEDARKPLSLHSIQIKWKWDDADMVEVSAKEIAKVFANMDTMVITNMDQTIALFSKLYSLKE